MTNRVSLRESVLLSKASRDRMLFESKYIIQYNNNHIHLSSWAPPGWMVNLSNMYQLFRGTYPYPEVISNCRNLFISICNCTIVRLTFVSSQREYTHN